MELDIVRAFLGWTSVINFAVLLAWFAIFLFARNWLFKIHSTWFSIPDEKFDTIHYCLMGAFELFVIAFFLAPYIAMRIIG